MGLFSGIGQSLKNLSFSAKISEEYFEEIEEQLILADVGVDTATKMTAVLRETARKDRLTQGNQLRPVLIQTAETILKSAKTETPTENPRVILVVGVNGAGKTTTIGKLSACYAGEGKRVILAAADTFRAAATEQLGIWAARTGAEMISHSQGADPAAVVCDAIRAAVARKADVVLCDTAGRLHNKRNLMEELSKIRRVIARELPGCVPEVLLVVDATTGQNGLVQAKSFREAAGAGGIVLTKLDGTAKGGIVLAIAGETGMPVVYVGVGETTKDLHPFDAGEFARALFGEETEHAE